MSVFGSLRLQLTGAFLASEHAVDAKVGAGQFLLTAFATIGASRGLVFRRAELRGARHGASVERGQYRTRPVQETEFCHQEVVKELKRDPSKLGRYDSGADVEFAFGA